MSTDSDEIEKKDVNQLIHDTISKLPERYSAIITMFYLNEMSIEEISEVMQITVSNVKVMLHRSRNALRDLIMKSKLGRRINMIQITDEILNKYLDGELSREEAEQVKSALRTSEELQRKV